MLLVASKAFKLAHLTDDLVMRARGWTATRNRAKLRHGLCKRKVTKWRIY
jgi:hypothetical protein